ncbi:MAG: VWA domain-containing protein [Myxococcota bacterium]
MTDVSIGLERPEWLLLLLLLPLFPLAARYGRRTLRRRRWWLALGLRALLLTVLALVLAEPTLRRPVDDLAVVFVVDGSASVGADGQAAALQFVQEALEQQRPGDRAGVVVFGAEAMVEQQLQADLRVDAFESRPNPQHSDLAAGLRLGTALLPGDRTRRLVLLTDGEQTHGDAAGQTVLAAGDDLQLSVVPLGGTDRPEVLIEDLVAPTQVDEGAAYEVRVVARAEQDATGTLRLYRNDRYLGEMPVTLPAGRSQVLSFRQQADAGGLFRYRAQLEVDPALDGQPENNVGVATVQVRGQPAVLLVERDQGQSRHLAAVLRGEGFAVDEVDPGGLPATLPDLRRYDAVFLSDVAAYTMSRGTQEALEVYVRDLGAGLVMLGGDESFGLGGWYDTPVERALPVRMDLDDKARFPKLGMVLALDKSCSMGDGGGSPLGMAKEAGIRTVELLSDRDALGFVTFDAASTWIAPLAPLEGRREQVRSDIASLRSGGGTDIYPAVDAAVTALRDSDNALKHIVLISDGMTTPGDYQTLIAGANRSDKITLTALAIGAGADQTTMKQMATWGGGQYYYVTDANAIPAIFTREALLATRAFLVEDPFVPKLAMPSDLTRGLGGLPMPTLRGYVATQPKPRAVVPLVADRPDTPGKTDPILAHWRYGLGRSVAFTSDAKARWARDWVGTASYTRLWTQVARWVAGGAQSNGLSAVAEIREGELTVTVDALDPAGGFRNFLDGTARVVGPDNRVHELALQQVGPGRYEARMLVDQDGSWLAGVQLSDADQLVGQLVAEAVQPYSPEYRRRQAGAGLVQELGRLGRGGVVTDPAAVFARPEAPRKVPRPLWPPLMALAAVLLLLDVASRRLMVSADPRAAAAGAAGQGAGGEAVGAGARARGPRRDGRRAARRGRPEPVEEEVRRPDGAGGRGLVRRAAAGGPPARAEEDGGRRVIALALLGCAREAPPDPVWTAPVVRAAAAAPAWLQGPPALRADGAGSARDRFLLCTGAPGAREALLAALDDPDRAEDLELGGLWSEGVCDAPGWRDWVHQQLADADELDPRWVLWHVLPTDPAEDAFVAERAPEWKLLQWVYDRKGPYTPRLLGIVARQMRRERHLLGAVRAGRAGRDRRRRGRAGVARARRARAAVAARRGGAEPVGTPVDGGAAAAGRRVPAGAGPALRPGPARPDRGPAPDAGRGRRRRGHRRGAPGLPRGGGRGARRLRAGRVAPMRRGPGGARPGGGADGAAGRARRGAGGGCGAGGGPRGGRRSPARGRLHPRRGPHGHGAAARGRPRGGRGEPRDPRTAYALAAAAGADALGFADVEPSYTQSVPGRQPLVARLAWGPGWRLRALAEPVDRGDPMLLATVGLLNAALAAEARPERVAVTAGWDEAVVGPADGLRALAADGWVAFAPQPAPLPEPEPAADGYDILEP